ncbi:MAG: phosphoribosylformylglycinamidine synthase subunit PurQ [Candidatus Sumerlaeaceae bacterium]
MKTAVVVFPGSNCEMDAERAVELMTGEAPVMAWHKDPLPSGTDLVVLPGGFSYGDYLRVGAIARFSPVMQSVIAHAKVGGLVLGICNGFQILLEAGLLPGAMVRNRSLHFQCRWVHLKVERTDTAFTSFEKQVLRIPIAHATGNYFIDPDGLKSLEANRQVVFRYCSPEGVVSEEWNVNGSVGSIAGIVNVQGNVLGMMPHPERAMEEVLGSTDGRLIWESVQAAAVATSSR